jgi:hypothetical protein
MILTRQQSKVWYKEPWPWLLMAGPAIVVVAGFITFYLAQVNAADLVSDDYYKDGNTSISSCTAMKRRSSATSRRKCW